MSNYFIVALCLLFACSANKRSDDAVTEYLEKDYKAILSKAASNKTDSFLQYGALCHLHKFSLADSLFAAPLKIKVIGGYIINDPIDTLRYEYYSVDNFPYQRYSSMDLLRFGVYYDSKYKMFKTFFNKLAVESFRKDTTNLLALYQILVFAGTELEVSDAFFIEHYLRDRKFQSETLDKIHAEIEDATRNERKKKGVSSLKGILNKKTDVFEFFPSLYERYTL